MSAKGKLIAGAVGVALVCGAAALWVGDKAPKAKEVAENSAAQEVRGELTRRLHKARRGQQRPQEHAGPSKAYLPEQWRSLPDDEANRRLIELWLFSTREADPAKRKQKLDALTLALRSRKESAILPLEAALADVEQVDQDGRNALLFAVGEVAHEVMWKSDEPSPEAVGQITEIIEAELAAPQTIAVGEHFADWPKEALANMMHHDGRFSEKSGEIHMSTDRAKMAAVGIFRKLGDKQAVARLQQIEGDASYSQPVRNMAKVSLAILAF